MATTQVKDLRDVLQIIEQYQRYYTWWRGQPESQPLVPGAFRDRTKGRDWEQNLALQFMSRAPVRHPHCPAHGDRPAWLFFMQHYRLQTRLLDWTESVLFAAYFAVEKEPEKPGELWMLQPNSLNQLQLGTDFLSVPEDPRVTPLFNAAFTREPYGGKIVAVGVREVDIRMMVQQSAFTLHDTPTPLEQMPNHEKFLVRFEIPAAAKGQIRRQLDHLGVSQRNLFPDLETLSKWLQGEL